MEVFGYWKCVVVLVFAVVQIGEGSLQCNLTCPNQQLSCTTPASNKQFLLRGHSLHGQVRIFGVDGCMMNRTIE